MDDFPLNLYIYDENGRYTEPIYINNESVLKSSVIKNLLRTAIYKKREVRITDTGDLLVFHAQNGEILFPTKDTL